MDNDTASEPAYLRQLCQDLRLLEPCLHRQGRTLQDDVDCIASFVCQKVPLDNVTLVRLSGSAGAYTWKQAARWSEDKATGDSLLELLRQNFQGLLDILSTGAHSLQPVEYTISLRDDKIADGDSRAECIAYPIEVQGNLSGIILFEKAFRHGRWTTEQKELLKELARITSMPLTLIKNNEYQQLYDFVFNTVMDSMSANVYITDIETDDILFMNRSMRKAFGIEGNIEIPCWKVLQKGMQKRCDFCPVQILLDRWDGKGELPSYDWEETNTINGRIYQNHDELIHWIDGSIVHLQQSIDITDAKKLSEEATIDELTRALTRRAGKQALENSLKAAEEGQQSVTIGLYDIDTLKQVNDVFGHSEGDRLLCLTAETVRENLPENAYLFRLSGDEFVVVFENMEPEEAFAQMRGFSKALDRRQATLKLPYNAGFCYGLAHVEKGQKAETNEVLAWADERMYEQKRQFHMEKTKKFRRKAIVADEQDFDYNKEYLYDALVQSTDDYIFLCNMKTGEFRYPKSMVEEFELPGEVFRNAIEIWSNKVHSHDRHAFVEANQMITDGLADAHWVEYRAKNHRGEWVWLRCRGHLVRDENGDPDLFAGMITNLGKKNKIDHMTGLFNKFEFEDVIRDKIQSTHVQSFGMMVLGLDDFKHVNDLYDRRFGDEVLRITSQKIQRMLPPDAAIYRLDGDEFGIIFDGACRNDMQRFYAAAGNLFKHQQECGGKKYYCTLSAGCSLYPDDATNYEDLLKYASYSLEYSKNGGKNRSTFFSKEILTHKARSLELIELLRESVEKDFEGFEVYYQPQVNAKNGEITGAEALARWKCDAYGAVSPLEFIALLEQSGLMVPVGKWILLQAVTQCKEWIKQKPDFVMSINLSYLQVIEHDFIGFLQNTLVQAQIPAENIVVELTESYLVQSSNTVRRIFEDIRGLGIKIAMDDFGTGYSSLGVLKHSPADIVKIDKTFIKGIKNSTFDETFIRFIIALCHAVGIKVCLEGVETEDEYEIVTPMSLDYIQGFLFGKPMPSHEFSTKFFEDENQD